MLRSYRNPVLGIYNTTAKINVRALQVGLMQENTTRLRSLKKAYALDVAENPTGQCRTRPPIRSRSKFSVVMVY